MKLHNLILTAAVTASFAHADETMRCGKWVVDSQVQQAELIAKCGKPTRKETETRDVWAPSQNDSGRNVVIGTTTIERWIYDRGPRAFVMVVTIVDGKVKSVDRAE